ncbi:receptor-like cytosolic serine/threonine-protein kinase RBK2 [Pyrus ussuriensis x Pyrus communis]|uniref:Receptor-like cytosolic serine/threonine-protein kinase RBK2 n=1 Tax=Pyrus ussuriensis x Pyrus communis TaxID=2448454 RepID=A0A5N5FJR3_9ROSA|nr:receptor-like cytosolic serine/threonine-protein kinase RBK2 [Pyrus ussuriensis x Pyrus communis]KAB2631935.1 receptor-like cytosolic serine/threonine-protein kinase RBK2 [Pyrus ussuriensis x Pyrus communis]
MISQEVNGDALSDDVRRHFIKQLVGIYEANSNLQKGSTHGIQGHSSKFRGSASKVSMNVHQSLGGQLTPLAPQCIRH